MSRVSRLTCNLVAVQQRGHIKNLLNQLLERLFFFWWSWERLCVCVRACRTCCTPSSVFADASMYSIDMLRAKSLPSCTKTAKMVHTRPKHSSTVQCYAMLCLPVLTPAAHCPYPTVLGGLVGLVERTG